MTNAHTRPAPAPTRGNVEGWVAANRQRLVVGLLVGAGVLAVIPLWHLILYYRDRSGNTAVFCWGLALALLALFGGLYLVFDEPGRAPGREARYRLLILALGGLAGACTFLLGLALPLGPWAATIVPPPTEAAPGEVVSNAKPILQVWRENWWRLAVIGLASVGGLLLMFLSLQLARSMERVSAGLRRLLYGYNSVLTGLLLLAILGLLNVLAYVHLWPFTLIAKDVDWTPSQLYTLSPATIDVLQKGIDGNVELIALMPESDQLVPEISRLVENIKKYNKNFTVVTVSPDRSPRDFEKYFQKYRKLFGEDRKSVV